MNDIILSNLLLWGLIIGTFVSSIPQFYRIHKNKNNTGISEKMVIMGVLSCTFTFLGMLNSNKTEIFTECNTTNYKCYLLLAGLFQLLSPEICYVIIYVLFYYYTENEVSINPLFQITSKKNKKIKNNFIFFNVFNLSFYVSGILLLFICNQKINYIFALVNSILGSIFGVAMWFPQIYKTYLMKGNYTLSVPSLAIHALGCFITVVFQTLFDHQGWLVIIPFLVGGFLEIVVIIMCVYYKMIGISKDLNIYHEFPPSDA